MIYANWSQFAGQLMRFVACQPSKLCTQAPNCGTVLYIRDTYKVK